MITTSILTILMVTAPTYLIIKGIDHAFKEISGKEKPITTIKFQDWSVGK